MSKPKKLKIDDRDKALVRVDIIMPLGTKKFFDQAGSHEGKMGSVYIRDFLRGRFPRAFGIYEGTIEE